MLTTKRGQKEVVELCRINWREVFFSLCRWVEWDKVTFGVSGWDLMDCVGRLRRIKWH